MAKCRYCFDLENLVAQNCKCTDAFVHFECACIWYKDKMKVTLTGGLLNENWSVFSECKCEVCNSDIDYEMQKKIIDKHYPGVIRKYTRGHSSPLTNIQARNGVKV